MPPPRRARVSSRPYYSVAAAERSSSTRGWLAVRRNRPSKRARAPADTIAQGDEDGTPLTDEILVGIFAGLPDFSDLVRCAATCKRWCRLVSGEAAFICRSRRRRLHIVRSLALGFFYSHRHGAAVPRFAATASASRRLALRQPSLNAFVEGIDDGLFDSSRLVASRNGLVVVELQRGKHERALKLCVCNPMTGEVTVLPSLGGKQIVRPYASTVVTADDYDDADNDDPPRAPSSYSVLLVYCRRGFTACRTYASDTGRWGAEEKVTDARRLGKTQMAAMAAGRSVVVRKVVYWNAKTMAFGLRLDTLQAEHVKMPPVTGYIYVPVGDTLLGVSPVGDTLLGVSPEGRLVAIQVVEKTTSYPSSNGGAPPLSWPPAGVPPTAHGYWRISPAIVVATSWGATSGTCLWDKPGQRQQVIEVVGRSLPAETTWIQLQWMCEKSGVVFFTAGCADDRTGDVYAMSLDKQEVEKVANHHGSGPSWENFHGYEMDPTSYLASLAMDEDDP